MADSKISFEDHLLAELEEIKATVLQICVAQMMGRDDKDKTDLWAKLLELANKDLPSKEEWNKPKIVVSGDPRLATRNEKA